MVLRPFTAALATALMGMLVGCASSPQPRYIAGNYYMGGDERCARFSAGNGYISCKTSQGEFTENRYPMTPSQMAMSQRMAAQRSADIDSLAAQMNATSRQVNQNAQEALNQSSQYQAPAVNSFGQPSSTVRCISTGIYTNCRH